jgi:hypothetical protein
VFRPARLNTPIEAATLNLPADWDAPRRFGEAVLVEESAPWDVTNDLRAFERVWVARPLVTLKGAPSLQAVNYPGAGGSIVYTNPSQVIEDPYLFRRPFGESVAVRETMQYFTVGEGGDYVDSDQIPLPTPFTATNGGIPVDYVAPWTSPTIEAYGALLNQYGYRSNVSLTRWRGSLFELRIETAPYR